MNASLTYYEDLVVAILAVNNYSLEKAYGLRTGLKKQGCFDPAKVRSWSHEEAVRHLVQAGYDRGATMNSIFAGRVQELAIFEESQVLVQAWKHLALGQKTDADRILLSIPGVGPTVLGHFWALQQV